MKVQEINTAEYDAIKDRAVDMSQDQLLDEFAHLTMRENELEGKVKDMQKDIEFANKLFKSISRKLEYVLTYLTDEQKTVIESNWQKRNKIDQ
tara:strand:- start:214 stop:492 length:279 start_codon:yes stop_codon:yes gene_type:complete